jgi:hypothetical protein
MSAFDPKRTWFSAAAEKCWLLMLVRLAEKSSASLYASNAAAPYLRRADEADNRPPTAQGASIASLTEHKN